MNRDSEVGTGESIGHTVSNGPLIFARVLDGHGGLRSIDWKDAQGWHPVTAEETVWLHLDRIRSESGEWLRSYLAIPEATIEVLTSDENRPRAFSEGDAVVTVLRGINFNPGAAPEDMVAMQIWANAERVVTLRREHLQTPHDVLATMERGGGPRTAGDLVTELVEQTVTKMNRSIVDMNAKIDELEAADEEAAMPPDETLDIIADIRRNCLALKRHMSPQHEALVQIGRDAPPWMSETNQRDIRETIDRLRRYIEDLTVSQESAIVLQDEINGREAARSNRTIYMLSMVAAIFLPLTFVTGLLGINVGGVPGADSANGFWLTVGILAAVLAVQIIVFRKLKWL